MDLTTQGGLAGLSMEGLGTIGKRQLDEVIKASRSLVARGLPAPIPEKILKGIELGTIRAQKHTIYSNFIIGQSSRVEMFVEGTLKAKGLRNINNARLEENELFYIYGLRFRTAEASAATDAGLITALYQGIDATAAHSVIETGFLQLTLDGRNVCKDFPISEFNTKGNNNVAAGFTWLDKPELLIGQQLIKGFIELGATTGLNAVTAGRFELLGIRVSA